MVVVKWVDILPGIRMEVRDGGIRFEVYDVSSIQVGKEDEVLENGTESLPPGIVSSRFATKEQMVLTSQGAAMLITYFTKLPPRNEAPFNLDSMTNEECIELFHKQRNEDALYRATKIDREELQIKEEELDGEAALAIARGKPLPSASEIAANLVKLMTGETTIEHLEAERELSDKPSKH